MAPPQSAPCPATVTETQIDFLYSLILFDDDEHTYDYVVEMMMALFGMTLREGLRVAYEVDHLGEALIRVCPLEEAVAGRDAIRGYGPDPLMDNSRGSMMAAVCRADAG